MRRVLFTVAAFVALTPAAAKAEPAIYTPVVIDGPASPPLEKGKGTGLCVTSAISPDLTPFPTGMGSAQVFDTSVNGFLEAQTKRTTTVVQSIFDLSNNNMVGEPISFGDFLDSMSGDCPPGGCGFFLNDSTTHFASRFRGFLNVTSDLAGKPIHIGLYLDDAASLTFYDKSQKAYPILTVAPTVGSASWRTTNTVTFTTPGLYPLEILYVEIAEHSALEMSHLDSDMTGDGGTFKDFTLPRADVNSINLKGAGFVLFDKGDFVETLSGQTPYPNASECKQCSRQFVNTSGNNGCDPGFRCNEAALCAPCESDTYCGPSCSACGGETRFCININGQFQCGACKADEDCKEGFRCDTSQGVCQQCRDDNDCERGNHCVEHTCVVCDAPEQCAGTSCNCCPKGSHGQQMTCAAIEENGDPRCIECTSDTDCKNACAAASDAECKAHVCDKIIGQCVEAIKNNSTPDCCGTGCARCPDEAPFCLPGPLGTACAECRSDMDCKDEQFCLSGSCTPCVQDRRCGERCTSCGGDTPFCFADRFVQDAACVRCEKDEQCKGGKCDAATHQCTKACAMTCAADKPFCDGEKCVECYADTQCPCGGTCDLTDNTCSPSCKTNGDCLGNEHCKWNDDATAKECAPGPMFPVECSTGLDKVIGEATNALEAEDGTFCGFDSSSGSCAASGSEPRRELPSAGLLGLISLALLAARRGRGKS